MMCCNEDPSLRILGSPDYDYMHPVTIIVNRKMSVTSCRRQTVLDRNFLHELAVSAVGDMSGYRVQMRV